MEVRLKEIKMMVDTVGGEVREQVKRCNMTILQMRELQSNKVVNEQRAVCVSWLCYTGKRAAWV